MSSEATTSRRFAIVVSFPGEHRRFVLNVVNRLAEHLGRDRVFYDEWYELELVGLDGDLKLRRYYREQSDVVVPFFSEHYAKDWCQIEWSAIRAMLKARRKEDAVIPGALDTTKVESWEDIDFAIRKGMRSGREIADLIVEAYRVRYPADPGFGKRSKVQGKSQKPIQTKKPHARNVTADISRILKYAPAELIGREAELKMLHDAWLKVRRVESPRPHILTFVALGGEGKTSLVAKWTAELAAQDWPGCDAAFAWSFYSQGTREQQAASSDLFLKAALTFFGDDTDQAFAASPAGAFEKGQRLARIVGQRRSLLILDGLEPLQYAPTAPTPGELKDQGLAALLKGLAAASHGLCIVATRYSLPDLKAFWQTTAPEVRLLRLSRDAGVHLLQTLGVRGPAQELATLVEDVKGHALTLTLLGSYLAEFHAGDIRKRDLVKMEKIDEEIEVLPDHPHHVFNVMDAYVRSLESSESRLQAESGGGKPAKSTPKCAPRCALPRDAGSGAGAGRSSTS